MTETAAVKLPAPRQLAPPLPPPRRPAAPRTHHRIGDRPEVLSAIFERRIHTVLYRRRVPSVALDYAAGLVAQLVQWDLAPYARAVDQLHRLPLPMAPGREVFVQEIAFSLWSFGQMVAGRPFAAELAVLRDDACRRFHVDQHSLRWVSTFAGPGTEWLMDDDTALALPTPALAPEHFNRTYPERIQRVGRGEIFVMKGKGFEPRAPGRGGPLHRSPSIEALGVRRLVCTLTLPP